MVDRAERSSTGGPTLNHAQEDFAAKVFGNNYGRPVIGYQNDLDAMGRREVAAFHARHYAPQNLTVAIVGDVDPVQVCGQRPTPL